MPRTGGYRYNMNHKDYWKQRAKEKLSESFATTDKVYEYIENLYKKNLINFCNEYKELVKPFIKDGELDAAALKAASAADMAFMGKYQRLVNEISEFTRNMNDTQKAEILEGLKTVYKNNVISNFEEFNVAPKSMELLNTAAIERAVRTPFTKDGREFSDRIWDNLNSMNANLRQVLSDSIATGQSIPKTVKQFKAIYGNSTYNTSRLIRTETMAAYSKASRDSYSSLGVEEMEVLVEADACDVCAEYEGKTISVEDSTVGVDYPPFHPFADAVLHRLSKRLLDNFFAVALSLKMKCGTA